MIISPEQAMEIRSNAAEFNYDYNALSACIDAALQMRIKAAPIDAFRSMDKAHIIWYCPQCNERHVTRIKKRFCSGCGKAISWEGLDL